MLGEWEVGDDAAGGTSVDPTSLHAVLCLSLAHPFSLRLAAAACCLEWVYSGYFRSAASTAPTVGICSLFPPGFWLISGIAWL